MIVKFEKTKRPVKEEIEILVIWNNRELSEIFVAIFMGQGLFLYDKQKDRDHPKSRQIRIVRFQNLENPVRVGLSLQKR